jgi:hypothetical protein
MGLLVEMVIATMVQLVREEVSVTVQMIGKGVPIVLFQPLKTSIPQVTMELRCTHIQKHYFTWRVVTWNSFDWDSLV